MKHKREAYIGMGIAVGVGLGVATDNIAIGVALGVAIGALLARRVVGRDDNGSSDEGED